MEAPLTTASDVIDALGGTAEAARKLGKSPQVVTNWRARESIPPEAYLIVTDLLKRTGKTAEPAIFRMDEPEATDTPSKATAA